MPETNPLNNPTSELLLALVEVQRTIQPVPEDKVRNDSGGKYPYASGPAVVEHTKAALRAQGLVLVVTSTLCSPTESGRGVVRLEGVVLHNESGGSLPLAFELPYVAGKGRPDDNVALASITKGHARMLRLLLAVSTGADADDDVEADAEPAAPVAKAPPVATAAKSAKVEEPPETKPAPKAKEPEPVKEPEPKADTPTKVGKPGKGSKHSRLPALGSVLEPAPSPAEDCKRFKAAAKRLGLDLDIAATAASRVPEGGKLRETTGTRFNYADAERDGLLGVLADDLEATIADLKSRKVHPVKSGWTAAVTEWGKDQITY